MRKKLFAAIVGCIAALSGFHATAGPIQIPFSENPFHFDDDHVGVVISNTVVQFVKTQNLPSSLVLTNLNPVKITQNSSPRANYPTFGAETLGIQIPFEDYNYVFMLWGSGQEALALLWYLEGTDPFAFQSPNGEYLTFYSLYGAKNGSTVPEHAPTTLLLALGCGAFLTAARRFSR